MSTKVGTYYSFWMTHCCPGYNQNKGQSSKEKSKYQLLYTYVFTS